MPTPSRFVRSIPARRLLAAALLAVPVLVAQPAHATNFTWDGMFSGRWDSSYAIGTFPVYYYTNWDNDGLLLKRFPAATDTVIFTGTTPNNTINLNGIRSVVTAKFNRGGSFSLTNGTLQPSGEALIESGASLTLSADAILAIGNDLTLNTGTLNVEAGGLVSNTVGSIGDAIGSTGVARVTGAGSTWINSGDLKVGFSTKGTLIVEAGGSVSNESGTIGHGANSTGTATVTGAGSTWINSDRLYVGFSGSGTLNVQAGGSVSNWRGTIGYSTLSGVGVGVATVTGPGSTWTNTSVLHVGGYGGNGTLNIEAGGTVSNTYGSIGYEGGSTGVATVTGAGSTWINSGDLNVGNGTLNIEAGGSVSNGLGVISSAGVATVTGAGSTWVNSGELRVGHFGNATLNIQAGGSVSNTIGMLGSSVLTGTTGVATVTGPGSTWTNSGDLVVGKYGNGTLNLLNQGQVLAQNITRGSGESTINVDGGTLTAGNIDVENFNIGQTLSTTGSYTQSAGQLNAGTIKVGGRGAGTLNVEAGDGVTTTNGIIGTYTGSIGTATVTGIGSTWTNTGLLSVGLYGTGTLNVEAGGLVSSTHGYIGAYDGSSGVAIVTGTNSVWTNTGGLYVGGLYLNSSNSGPGGSGLLGVFDQGLVTADSLLIYASNKVGMDTSGRMQITNSAQLAGELTIGAASGYTPVLGDSFSLITSGALTGTFQNIAGVNTAGAGKAYAVTYTGTDVMVTVARPGDADLNNSVNFTDLNLLLGSYGGATTGQTWATGDFTGNGDVEFGDLNLLLGNYGVTASASAPLEASALMAAGEVQLMVNADGSLTLEGDTASILSYQILSASGLLVADGDGPELGLLGYASNTAFEIAAFGLAPVAVDGLNPIDPAVSTLDGLDLVFNYGLASGATVSGTVVVIPEPTSLASLALGGLLLLSRRRRTA